MFGMQKSVPNKMDPVYRVYSSRIVHIKVLKTETWKVYHYNLMFYKCL